MTIYRYSAALLACLALFGLGCDTEPTDSSMDTILADPGDLEFDSALADGHLLGEHVEVQPGVWMLQSVLDEGEIALVDPEEVDFDLDELYLAADDGPSSGHFDCAAIGRDRYSDSTVNGSLFAGNPKWAGELMAVSLYDQRPGLTINTDVAVIALDQVAPRRILKNDVRGYVWINGEYVGFLYNRVTGREGTAAMGIFTASCAAGQLDVAVVAHHAMFDIGHPGRLTIARPLLASVQCCPL